MAKLTARPGGGHTKARLSIAAKGIPASVRKLRIVNQAAKLKELLSKFNIAKRAGRPGVGSLGRSSEQQRLERAEHKGKRIFETVTAAEAEERLRIRLLCEANLDPTGRKHALRLAGRLEKHLERGTIARTLASKRYMRRRRLRVIGALLRLHDQLAHLQPVVFTLIPRGYWLTPEELQDLDARLIVDALRAALKRAGSGQADGALIAFIHGEFDEGTGRYQLHYHGWAVEGMVEVLEGLRKQRAYISTKTARQGDSDGVRKRLVISDKPISNPEYRLSYLLQPFWPGRKTGDLSELKTGKQGRYRVRAKHRIPEPFHSRYLLWLDQWRIEDISLLMGMTVKDGRLQLTSHDTLSIKGEG